MKPQLLEKPHAIVTVGPMQCQAVAPHSLAVGPIRPIAAIDLAHDDREALDALFGVCPFNQWGAAAQAAMSIR